jgi:peptidoglycan/LPS O-acetylase OafA/YrhL
MKLQQRIVILDFYRFVAAYGVALYHITEFAGRTGHFASVVRDFGLFVDFFFILSGFVIGKNYAEAVGTRSEILRFVQKRIARIYPLYLATTLAFLSIFLLGFSSHPESYRTLPIIAQLFMAEQWQLNPSLPLNFPAWSISAEWAMYLLFPALAILGHRGGNMSLLLFAALSAAFLLLLVDSGIMHQPIWSSLRALPTFTIGVVLSRLTLKINNGATIGAAIFGSSIVLLLLHAPSLVVLAAFCATIGTTAADPEPAPLLKSKTFGVLGDLSYSIYMVHALCYSISYKLLAPKFATADLISFGVVVSILVVLVSFPIYYFFENPARKLLSAPLVGRPITSTSSA